jgi:HAD superfamily hydrolase (TIGR01549 family)
MTTPKLTLDGIHAILFDLDGTLRHSHPSFDQVFFDHVTAIGVPVSEEGRRRALRWAHYYFANSPEVINDYQNLGHDQDQFFSNYFRRVLLMSDCDPDQVEEIVPTIYHRMKDILAREDKVDPEAADILMKLNQAGFVLGVVSNRHQPLDELMQTLGLGKYLDFTLVAGEVDSWKPDPGIFEHACDRAGTDPASTMYVGDNYYADIVGAQRAGVQPVLLDPQGLFPDADCPVIRSLSELVQGSRFPQSH